MADAIEFPEIGVRLTRDQWMAVILTLAGKPLGSTHRAALAAAEHRIMQQLDASTQPQGDGK